MPKGRLDFFHHPIKESSDPRNWYNLQKQRKKIKETAINVWIITKMFPSSLSMHTHAYTYMLLSVNFQAAAGGRILGLGFR